MSDPPAKLDPHVHSIGFFDEDLCTRCGTCGGACPHGAISFNERRFPAIDLSLCNSCGLCGRVCPGDEVNYGKLSEMTFGIVERLPSFDGRTLATYVGYCTDTGIREAAAGGGVITGLCWDLIQSGTVDGCVVTRMKPDRPWEGEAFIARTYEDLRQSQGSRYTIIPVNEILGQIRKMEGKYALVALPCQIHGYRMLAEEDKALAAKIHVVIGLFCGGSLEPHLIPEILATKGLKPTDIRDFQFRGGTWPGRLQAIRHDGTVVPMHNYNYDDGAYNYLTHLYTPSRCQVCLDGSAQFADIAVGDAWTRDEDGNYKFFAQSRIFPRTPIGMDVLKGAMGRGVIEAIDVSTDPSYRTHKMATTRKGTGTPIRIRRRQAKGIPVPKYDVEFGEFTAREKFNERVSAFFLWCGKHKAIRYPLLWLLTSKLSIPMIWLRRKIKKRKYAKRKKARLKQESARPNS